MELGPGTAIGEAIFASLEAVEQAPASDDSGEPVPAHIVVMSDGKTTMGRDNSLAAETAAEAEVPVSTIAFGTPQGEISEPGFEEPTPVPVEPEASAEIANATGGTAFEAATLDELAAVYEDIGSDVGHETEEQEVTYRCGLGRARAAGQRPRSPLCCGPLAFLDLAGDAGADLLTQHRATNRQVAW